MSKGGVGMSEGIWRRILDFFGFDEVEEGEGNPSQQKHRQDKIISLHRKQGDTSILVMEPSSYEEAREIVDHLLNKRPIIINLEGVNYQLAKRIIDFVSGSTYALQGDMRKIGDSIFLFTPSNVNISGQELERISFWEEGWHEEENINEGREP